MFRAQISVRIRLRDSSFVQHFNPVRELQSQGFSQILQRRERVLRINYLQLLRAPFAQPVEHVYEQLVDDVQNFAVVFFNRHLEIQPGKLAQVTVRVAIFRAKYRSNLKDPTKIRHNSHLFIQLRRLCQTRRLPHVIQLEHARAAFRGARNQLWRVNLYHIPLPQRLAKQRGHFTLNSKNRVIRRRSQI